jgi:hypothetical protein
MVVVSGVRRGVRLDIDTMTAGCSPVQEKTTSLVRYRLRVVAGVEYTVRVSCCA